MTIFQTILQKIRRPIIWVPLVILIGVGGYFLFRKPTATKNEYQTVTRKTFTDSVQGSGTVSTEKQVSLAAQSSGKVSQVLVVPGQRVSQGQVIARIDARDQSVSYEQSTNELEQAQLSLDNSLVTLKLTKKEQDTAVKNAYRSLLNSDVSTVKVGDYTGFTGPTVSGTYMCDKEGTYTLTSVTSSGGISIRYSGLEDGGVFISDIPRAFGSCGLFLSVPTGTTVPANATWQIVLPNKQAQSYNNNYNAYISALDAKDKALINAEQSVASATLSVKKAQTSLKSAQNSLSNTIVTAPFAGQIGTVPVQVGEQISSGTSVATLVTDGKVADITLNEVDVAKVVVGQRVELSFDAVEETTLSGTVSEIDTIGTTTQNVVSFKVRILFTQDDVRVKPGMTVTATIITKEKPDVVVVPTGVIKKNAKGSYVQIKDVTQGADTLVNVPVTTGDSTDTETEITEGLQGGEEVLVRTVTVTSGAKATTASASRQSGSPFGR